MIGRWGAVFLALAVVACATDPGVESDSGVPVSCSLTGTWELVENPVSGSCGITDSWVHNITISGSPEAYVWTDPTRDTCKATLYPNCKVSVTCQLTSKTHHRTLVWDYDLAADASGINGSSSVQYTPSDPGAPPACNQVWEVAGSRQ